MLPKVKFHIEYNPIIWKIRKNNVCLIIESYLWYRNNVCFIIGKAPATQFPAGAFAGGHLDLAFMRLSKNI